MDFNGIWMAFEWDFNILFLVHVPIWIVKDHQDWMSVTVIHRGDSNVFEVAEPAEAHGLLCEVHFWATVTLEWG